MDSIQFFTVQLMGAADQSPSVHLKLRRSPMGTRPVVSEPRVAERVAGAADEVKSAPQQTGSPRVQIRRTDLAAAILHRRPFSQFYLKTLSLRGDTQTTGGSAVFDSRESKRWNLLVPQQGHEEQKFAE